MIGLDNSSSLAIVTKVEKSELLTLSEYKELRLKFGFREKCIKIGEIENNFSTWYENKLISINEINLVKFYQYYKGKNTLDGQRERIFCIDYILMNMIFEKINLNRNFVIENVLTKNAKVMGRLNLLSYMYNQKKPEEFPDISELKQMKNKWFAISLVLFNSSINNFNDKDITDELFFYYKLHSNRARDLAERFKEFAKLFYLPLVKLTAMDRKENIIEYLFDVWLGRPLSDVDDIWRFLHSKLDYAKKTEFYDVIYNFVNECISKNLMDSTKLKTTISDWERLTNLCLRYNVKFVKDIKKLHRDEFIRENIEKIKMEGTFNSIRKILEFYNDIVLDDEIDAQDLIYYFSVKHLPKRPKNINHVGLMETGLKALISSLGSEIIKSRTKSILEMNSYEIGDFFIVRLIWVTMITGARVSEVANLLLNDVKNTLEYNEPYIKLNTLKDNNDREIVLSRGEKLDEERYELDVIHIDIIKETVEVSQLLYSELDLEVKYLFPNFKLSKYDNTSVYLKIKKIQQMNGIVCGSHYDILSREIYESFSYLNKKLIDKRELFTTHDLRHGNINWMLLHGGLSRYEIQDYIGHRNISSQEDYERTNATMLKVAEMMEVNDHYGAKNELVSPNYIKIDDNIDRSKLLLNKDIEEYLMNFELGKINIHQIKAEQYIDQNTDCNVIISCSASGMSCLACKDFDAGSYSQEKLDNITIILSRHINTINEQIEKINKNKRSLLTKKGETLLVNAISSLIDRFVILEDAKKVTLVSPEQGFGIEEKDAQKIINHLLRKNRNNDLDAEFVKKLKTMKIEGKINFDLTFYRTVNNRRIFA